MTGADNKEPKDTGLAQQMGILRHGLRIAVPELDAAADLIKTICFRMEADHDAGWQVRS